MRFRYALICVSLLIAASAVAGSARAGDPFEVRVAEASDGIPLGLPIIVVAEVANVSGIPQPIAFLHVSLRLHVVAGPAPAMHCLQTSRLEGDRYAGWPAPIPGLIANRTAQVPNGWTTEVERSFLPPEPGEYSVVMTFSMSTGTESQLGEPEEVWVGSVSSAPVKVVVVEPRGDEAEVFEHYAAMTPPAYSCSRARRFTAAFGMRPEKPEPSDLLRTFPNSIYAANSFFRILTDARLSFSPGAVIKAVLGRDLKDFKGHVPCSPPDTCLEGGTVYLRGADYLQWKLGWCERILEHHPKVWFADGVRYAAATYRYLLGDKAGCAAQLRDLALHGRPYVATKAGELLAAMQAKGMLEEKAK